MAMCVTFLRIMLLIQPRFGNLETVCGIQAVRADDNEHTVKVIV
jgi:hypothetical protein